MGMWNQKHSWALALQTEGVRRISLILPWLLQSSDHIVIPELFANEISSQVEAMPHLMKLKIATSSLFPKKAAGRQKSISLSHHYTREEGFYQAGHFCY